MPVRVPGENTVSLALRSSAGFPEPRWIDAFSMPGATGCAPDRFRAV